MQKLKRTKVSLKGKREPHIFLCHSSTNKDFVRKLAKDLNYFGLDGWLDEWEIEAGDYLHESIGNALQKCRYVGVVISPSFIESEWCNDELRQSLSREKRQKGKVVIPLLCGKAIPPAFIEDRLYLDFSNNYYSALVRLCGLLHKFSQKRVSEKLAVHDPKSLKDASEILTDLGWERTSLVDSGQFVELCDQIKELCKTDPDIRKNVISMRSGNFRFYSDIIRYLNGKLDDELLDLFRPFE